MILTIFNQDQVIPPDSEQIDETVQLNIMRVRGAQVLQNAMNNAEKQNFEEGQKIIKSYMEEIKKA